MAKGSQKTPKRSVSVKISTNKRTPSVIRGGKKK